ncbi:hypothetical protein LCGC14_2887410, partial [marine sediment metagenome]
MKRKTKTIRNLIEYSGWKKFAEFLDTNPEIPEIMRYIEEYGWVTPN